MELSIVVPVYNSSSIVSELCSQLVDALSEIDIEIILVDDGSADTSWQVIKQLAKQIEQVQGFRLARNFGQVTPCTSYPLRPWPDAKGAGITSQLSP